MNTPFDQQDLPITNEWALYRDAYEGGTNFRDKYLERFEDEKYPDFLRRKALCPTTDFAKAAVQRVLALIVRLFPDILRRGGNATYQQAVVGSARGVDGRGTAMNHFLAKKVLPELLVIGKVGTLVDAPSFNADSRADVPANYQPYFRVFPAERIEHAIAAEPNSPSDFQSVLLKETDDTYLHWLLQLNGNVSYQKFDKNKEPMSLPIELEHLKAIPFAMVDIGSSLMTSIAPYQRAMLNAASREIEYALNSNTSFLAVHTSRQRFEEKLPTVSIGPTKGMQWSDEPPAFVTPDSSAVLGASGALAERMQKDIEILLNLSLDSVGGIEMIVLALEAYENRLCDHFASYYSQRQVAAVEYPREYLTATQKLEIASKLFELSPKVLSNTGKRVVNGRATDLLLVGHAASETIAKVRVENDKAPYAVCDPAIVAKQRELDIVGTKTAAQSAGYPKDEHLRAKEDRSEAAAALTQAMQQAKHGADELEVNPELNAKAEKEISQSGATDLTPGKKVRGEGQ